MTQVRNDTRSTGFSPMYRLHVKVLCQGVGAELLEINDAAAVANGWGGGSRFAILKTSITVQPIVSRQRYLTALHEVGHVAERHHGNTETPANRLREEYEAWAWAFKHAKITPTDDEIEHAVDCLASYHRHYGETPALSVIRNRLLAAQAKPTTKRRLP